MSRLSIAAYFPFARTKVTYQSVSKDATMAVLDIKPDRRFRPVCSVCHGQGGVAHQNHVRSVRDLHLASAEVYLRYHYRNIRCASCGRICTEELDVVAPYARVTRRLAMYVYELCKKLTVKDVARHTGLDRKTVKKIDKEFLEEEFGKTDYGGLEILAIDEISISKGHKYMTVVLDYQTGRVVWMGEDRTKETLDAFFSEMPEDVRKGIKAVAMDMWKAYINRVKHWCPNAKIVFDFYHVVRDFNKVIDKVRRRELARADGDEKELLKGSRYLFLKNDEKLSARQKVKLDDILKVNSNLNAVYILKDALKLLYSYDIREKVSELIDLWCQYADQTGIPEVSAFGRRLQMHREGILNHCDYNISTEKLEGTNNTIKVIKRKAYGYRDQRYFTLKVKQQLNDRQRNWT